VPEWKWEEIAMDFIVGLPRTQSGYDSIWVIVDRLTKVAQFIPIKTTYSGLQIVELYISRIVGRSLPQGFGRGCMKPWIPNCISVLPILLRPMVRQ
jgi:hypothetical protein